MIKYNEEIEVNHPIEKTYKLVAEVDKYPSFIPWCEQAELLKVENEDYYYKIGVKFGMFSQQFITKDRFIVPKKVEINLVEGPFKNLYSVWDFVELNPNKTLVKFYIEFEFKSLMLNKLLGKVFLDANKQILHSFLNQLDNK